MNTECWQRIQEVFNAALEQPLSKRESFLNQACAGDASLREELNQLLAHDAVAERGGFMPPPPGNGADSYQHFGASNNVAADRSIPPGYEIMGELGRGGMGVVYKARQIKVNRLVALKMILAGGHAASVELTRFHREAEAVARLEHPHVVRLYDYGEWQELPYFSMEFLEGGNLAQKLVGTPQPALESAKFVEALAQAIHYAHQHGIVHRDLKPANILLGVAGGERLVASEEKEKSAWALATKHWLLTTTPKITDFGLAKQLDAVPGQTQSGSVMGTPSYMAPEQAEGKAKNIGPATDVYALGAILYELLTGRPPFEADTPLETMHQVLSEEPVSVSRLQTRVPRDLETICLKCLRKEPKKRYASARELADDLRRFLDGKPIQARPAGSVERVWRWARRNPRVAGLSAALGMVLMAGFTGVFWQWRRAEANYRVSQENLLQSRFAYRDLINVGGDVLRKSSHVQPLRRKYLERALKGFQDLAHRRSPDPELKFDLAYVYHLLAILDAETGKLSDALANHQQAEVLLQEVSREREWNMGTSWSDVQNVLAANYLYVGFVRSRLGEYDQALDSHRQALKILDQLVNDYAWHQQYPKYRRNQALTHWAIGEVYLARARVTEANDHYKQALPIRERLLNDAAKNDSQSADYKHQLCHSLHSLGVLQEMIGKSPEALQSLNQAHKLRTELVKEYPDDIWWQRDLAKTKIELAKLHLDSDRGVMEAKKLLTEARVGLEKLASENPTVTDFQESLADCCFNLGKLHRRQGLFDEALAHFKKAQETCEKLQQDNAAVVEAQIILADCSLETSLIQESNGHPDQALDSLQQAQVCWEKLAKAHPKVPRFRSGLAKVYFETGGLLSAHQKSKALSSYQQTCTIQKQLVSECPDISEFRKNLGRTHEAMKQVKVKVKD